MARPGSKAPTWIWVSLSLLTAALTLILVWAPRDSTSSVGTPTDSKGDAADVEYVGAYKSSATQRELLGAPHQGSSQPREEANEARIVVNLIAPTQPESSPTYLVTLRPATPTSQSALAKTSLGKREQRLHLNDGVAQCSFEAKRSVEYCLSVIGPTGGYIHPEPVKVVRGNEHTVEVVLETKQRIEGRVLGLPHDGAGHVVGFRLQSPQWQQDFSVEVTTRDGGVFEFDLLVDGATFKDFELLAEWGYTALKISQGHDVILLTPDEELVGVALLESDGVIENREFATIVVGKHSIRGRNPIRGVQTLPRRFVKASEKIIFELEGFGALGFSLGEAEHLPRSVLAFRSKVQPQVSGAIRIRMDRSVEVGEDLPEISVVLQDLGTIPEVAMEPHKSWAGRDFLISGLTPETYDIHWVWGSGHERLLAEGVAVLPGEESVLSAKLLTHKMLEGSVLDWERIPRSLRANKGRIETTSFAIRLDGTFRVHTAIPFSESAMTFIAGVPCPATAAYYPESERLLVSYDHTKLRVAELLVPPLQGGLIHAYVGARDSMQGFSPKLTPFVGAADFGSDGDGRVSFVMSEEFPVCAAFYEYPRGDWSARRFRGWKEGLAHQEGLTVVELPGREVEVRLVTVEPGALRLFAQYVGDGGWQAPLAHLGDYDFSTLSEVVWLPSQSTELVVTDEHGDRLTSQAMSEAQTVVDL